jgi:putative ATP-dependent endonuclease of OLD family
VDILNLEGLVLVRKEGGMTSVTQIDRAALVRRCEEMGVPPGRATADNILPFYAGNATREILEGLFAKVVVLVEGPSESLSLPVYLRKVDLEVTKEGIAVIPVHGKGNLAKWRRLFAIYGIPCYVIFDNDGEDDEDRSRRRDALIAAGIREEEHGGYVNTDNWLVNDDVSVFGSDFETALRRYFADYSELETQTRRQGIESKPLVARQVAEQLQLDETEGWQKFRQLADKLRALVPAVARPLPP